LTFEHEFLAFWLLGILTWQNYDFQKTRVKITSVLTRVHVSICTQGSKSQCICLVNCGEILNQTAGNSACNISARLPGKAAGQGCRARLPGKAAGQGCRARLPRKAAAQGCRARLPGKAAGQGCRARLPGKAAGQGCWARLPGNGGIC
jgi:hypothetical protein